MSDHPNQVAAVAVGGFIGIAHFAHIVEPFLADLSYLGALIVTIVTLWQKWRK
jgi:hypothetical protein